MSKNDKFLWSFIGILSVVVWYMFFIKLVLILSSGALIIGTLVGINRLKRTN